MAVGVNKMPQDPRGPARDSIRYTSSRTTTEGMASKVLMAQTTTGWPTKRLTANHAPTARPSAAPIRLAVPLTWRDNATVCHNTGSPLMMSSPARCRLCARVVMGGDGHTSTAIVSARHR